MDEPSGGGQIIASRYQLVRQLGKGGMGSVWWARDLTLGSPVAVKLIDAELASDGDLRARFYQEAQSAAALRSPHVVQILDYGVDRGIPFIAMELLEGESLASRLGRVRVLPYAETARVLLDVARAMKKAHDAGIVHRDLKPDNIFLVRNDDQEVAKVLDFGIAKATRSPSAQAMATRSGTVMGTLPYMSPEQATGNNLDWRTDLWALGVIAFECVCGRLPFTADVQGKLVLQICVDSLPVPSRIARVPPGFDAFWARAAHRDPERRFQSAKELAEALAQVLGAGTAVGGPSLPSPGAEATGGATSFGQSAVTTAVWAGKPRRRARALVAGGVAAVAVAGIVVGWLALRPSAAPSAAGVPTSQASPLAASLSVPVPVPVVVPAPAPSPEPSEPPSSTVSPATPPAAPAGKKPGRGAATSAPTAAPPAVPPKPPATVPPTRTMD
jgi:serine/threonine-protein kinase